jgi:cytochrome c-type biogenesis protein CcmH
VGEDAIDRFRRAVAASPKAFKARFYLARGQAQAGQLKEAVEAWRAIEAESPADAPWLDTVRDVRGEAEQELANGGAPTPAPVQTPAGLPGAEDIAKLPPDARLSAIRGMVEGLAAKLEANPGDATGWQRLGRAYLVLGEAQKSADAYGHAAALLPKDPAPLLGRAQALASGQAEGTALPAAALEAYRQVLALDPRQPDALWQVGLAARQAGKADEAARYWGDLVASLPPGSNEAKQVQTALDGLKKP